MSFWGELKRRKVFQVATVYAMTAWLLVQVMVSVCPQCAYRVRIIEGRQWQPAG